MIRFNIFKITDLPWRTMAANGFAATFLLFVVGGTAISSDDAFLLQPGKSEKAVAASVEPTTISLPNGNDVNFTPLYNAQGLLHSIALSERVRHDNLSAIAHPQLAGSNARQLFHALAPYNTPTPRFLLIDRNAPEPTEPQGWARPLFESLDKDREGSDRLTTGPITAGGPVNCYENAQPYEEMADEAAMFGYTFAYLGEGISQSNFPQYWEKHDSPGSWEGPLYQLYGAVYDVEAFYSTVVGCHIDYGDYVLDEWYPESVEYEYRIGTGGFTGTGQHIVFPADKVVFYWTRSSNDSMPYGIDLAPDDDIDFRLHIKNASALDTFNIAATWSKPFDSFKSGK